MKSLNFGCGLDVRDGWVNVDKIDYGQPDTCKVDFTKLIEYSEFIINHGSDFDFILANHVLHMIKYVDWEQVVYSLSLLLKPGGKLMVVEFDPLKAYKNYLKRDGKALIIPDDVEPTIDGKFGRYLTYHSTRRMIITPIDMCQKLMLNGFSDARIIEPVDEKYGRVNESFQVEATK